MKETFILQNWCLVGDPSPYVAPEAREAVLCGNVYGSPKFPDGDRIMTSAIIRWIDDETIETQNTIYKLGAKDEDYKLFLQGYEANL